MSELDLRIIEHHKPPYGKVIDYNIATYAEDYLAADWKYDGLALMFGVEYPPGAVCPHGVDQGGEIVAAGPVFIPADMVDRFVWMLKNIDRKSRARATRPIWFGRLREFFTSHRFNVSDFRP